MSRVIAVQEEQLNIMKENYKKSAPAISAPLNNADVLSGSLENSVSVAPAVPMMPEFQSAPAMPSGSPLDMEAQAVNLNVNTVQPSGIVNNDVTNQVFGATSVNPISEPVQPVSDGNIFASANVPQIESPANSAPIENNPIMSVPYQEPVMNSAPANAMSDDAFVKYINSLRDKFTNFYNDMNMELDKIQEQIVQKSGVSLVENNSVASVSQVIPEIKQEANVVPVAPAQSDFSMNSGSGNIFDVQMPVAQMPSPVQSNSFDETMVIPRNVMDNAIAEAQNGMAKVA